jgi:hypothetical protein
MNLVSRLRILFNVEADRLFCILDAPTKEAAEKHHEKYGAKCEIDHGNKK